MQYLGGTTNTKDALEVANVFVINDPTNRASYPDVVILIQDGTSSADASAVAKQMRDAVGHLNETI